MGKSAKPEDRPGIQSIEVGMPLITVLARRGVATSLSVLASGGGMSASKAHKYLTSFVRIGLVKQESANGLYDLGPLALEFGLAALRRLDVVDLARAPMQELQSRIDETITLTIWSQQGPTTIRVVENDRPVAVTVKLGGVLPLLTSSNGRVFLTWLDRPQTARLVEAELADPSGAARREGLLTLNHVEALIAETRDRGVAVVRGLVVPGIFAYSAPVWGAAGLCAALTVVGIMGGRASREADDCRLLLETANSLSRQLSCDASGAAEA